MYTENKLWSSLSKLISSKIHIVTQDGIFKESIEARNRGGMESSYQPSRAGIFKKSMGLGTEEE
jgi:hypothetical protein